MLVAKPMVKPQIRNTKVFQLTDIELPQPHLIDFPPFFQLSQVCKYICRTVIPFPRCFASIVSTIVA